MNPSPLILQVICLARSLCELTERDVYVASAWHGYMDFEAQKLR